MPTNTVRFIRPPHERAPRARFAPCSGAET
jgi:hypothetical protein